MIADYQLSYSQKEADSSLLYESAPSGQILLSFFFYPC